MPINTQYQTLSQLPGPKGLPILGNLMQIELTKLHQILEQWADSYGDIYTFKLANKQLIGISNLELIQKILRERPQTYRRISTLERVARELSSHGVFSAEGKQWQRQRYITMQAFKPECLQRFFPTLQQITTRLHQRWHMLANSGQAIDINKEWTRFTVDITTQFAFGYDINLLENKNDDFQQHLARQLPTFNRRVNAPFPYWHFIKLPSDLAMEKSLNVIKETIALFIQQARQQIVEAQNTPQQPANFLQALLTAQDEKGLGFSDEEIQGNIMTLLLAGEDTTAHTLSWLVYLITEYPDVQRNMQQEVDSLLASKKADDMSFLEQLPYIEAVIHETLRLKSVAPLLFMEPITDVELAGIAIPKGTALLLLTRHVGLQEPYFTDAQHFKPERWLATHTHTGNHQRSASMPFGAGPRFCPGRGLALLEMKMALAMICQYFTLSRIDNKHPVEEVFSFTMMPANLQISLTPR